MDTTTLESVRLIGLALKTKTRNADGQSGIDCGSLWQEFGAGDYAAKVPGKLGDEIYAVYHDYEGDHTGLFSFFIGFRVAPGSEAPEGMTDLTIPAGTYEKFTAKGKMPDCVADTWKKIWTLEMPRAYQADFEVYGQLSHDWSNAEVDIFIGVKA